VANATSRGRSRERLHFGGARADRSTAGCFDDSVQRQQPAHDFENGKVERSHKTDSVEFYRGRHYRHKKDLARKLKRWEAEYNEDRPHLALKRKTPAERVLELVHLAGHSEVHNAPSRTLPTRPRGQAKMSLVKSYFYLTKMRCRAVPASLSQGLGFAETPDSFEVRGPPSPSSVLSRK
jgi:hypothetical protein